MAGVVYLAYRASGADDITGLWEWLRSLATRAALKLNSILGDVMSGDDQTKAINKALDLIAQQEGFSSVAYNDPPGSSTYSIGYGHQITPGDGLSTSSKITEAQAYELLSDDVQSRVDCVLGSLTVDVTVNQLAALISFAYNIGCSAFHSSTLVKLLNSGDTEGAAAEFSKWVYSGGQVSESLVSRRETEQNLFLEA